MDDRREFVLYERWMWFDETPVKGMERVRVSGSYRDRANAEEGLRRRREKRAADTLSDWGCRFERALLRDGFLYYTEIVEQPFPEDGQYMEDTDDWKRGWRPDCQPREVG